MNQAFYDIVLLGLVVLPIPAGWFPDVGVCPEPWNRACIRLAQACNMADPEETWQCSWYSNITFLRLCLQEFQTLPLETEWPELPSAAAAWQCVQANRQLQDGLMFRMQCERHLEDTLSDVMMELRRREEIWRTIGVYRSAHYRSSRRRYLGCLRELLGEQQWHERRLPLWIPVERLPSLD